MPATNTGFSGQIMFGLCLRGKATIQRLIESLDNAAKCSKYVFVDMRDEEGNNRLNSRNGFQERYVVQQKVVYKDEELTLLANLKAAAQQDGDKKQELLELLKVNVGANYDEHQPTLPDLSKKKFRKNLSSLLRQASMLVTQQESATCEALLKV